MSQSIRELHEARCGTLRKRKEREVSTAQAESYESSMESSKTEFLEALTNSAQKWAEESKLTAYEFHLPIKEFEMSDVVQGRSFAEMYPYLFRDEDYTYFGKAPTYHPRVVVQHLFVDDYRLVLLRRHTNKFILAYEHKDTPSYCLQRWEPPCVVS